MPPSTREVGCECEYTLHIEVALNWNLFASCHSFFCPVILH